LAAFYVLEVHKQTDKVAMICKTDRCNLAKELDTKAEQNSTGNFLHLNTWFKKKNLK
jgi:hypothetical protein